MDSKHLNPERHRLPWEFRAMCESFPEIKLSVPWALVPLLELNMALAPRWPHSHQNTREVTSGPRPWNSPGHGSIDGQSCGVGVSEPSCRDGVHGLTLPTKKGVQSQRQAMRSGGVGAQEKRRKGKSSLCIVSFILIWSEQKSWGLYRKDQREETQNNLNAINLIGMAN